LLLAREAKIVNSNCLDLFCCGRLCIGCKELQVTMGSIYYLIAIYLEGEVLNHGLDWNIEERVFFGNGYGKVVLSTLLLCKL
jgi:hypothetical protein